MYTKNINKRMGLLSLIIVLGLIFSLGKAVSLQAQEAVVNEELMFGFEDESELRYFENATPPLQLSTEHATQGKHSVKLSGPNLGRKNLLKVYLEKTNFADMSGYEYLALDIYNATDAHVFVTIKIEDKNHKDLEIEERGIAPKMKETLEFPITTMKSKGIDPANMYKFDMWVTTAPSNFSLHVDNMRLGIKSGTK